jgi:hypothetical protein
MGATKKPPVLPSIRFVVKVTFWLNVFNYVLISFWKFQSRISLSEAVKIYDMKASGP